MSKAGMRRVMGAWAATDKATLFRANGSSSEPCGDVGGIVFGRVGRGGLVRSHLECDA